MSHKSMETCILIIVLNWRVMLSDDAYYHGHSPICSSHCVTESYKHAHRDLI